MTVKSVMHTAAVCLGIADVVDEYINKNGGTQTKTGDLLLQCFNMVENELALDYIPLFREDEMTVTNGKILYSSFGSDVSRIVKVTDLEGRKLPFKLFATYLQVSGERVRVRYAYMPAAKVLSGVSDFKTEVSERLFAYGMAAEYAMTTGLYEEAAVWDKKYKEGIEALRRGTQGGRVPARRWA